MTVIAEWPDGSWVRKKFRAHAPSPDMAVSGALRIEPGWSHVIIELEECEKKPASNAGKHFRWRVPSWQTAE